jgi:carbonic anhydrase
MKAFGDNRDESFDFDLSNAGVDVGAFIESLNLNNFWSFEGSLTTPPCWEGVEWSVLQKPAPISPEHLAALDSRYVDNANFATCEGCSNGNNRVTMPLNARTLYYNDSGAISQVAMTAVALSALATLSF